MAGLATSFGSGAMTNSIADVDKSAAFLVIGSNTTWNHPIIGDAVKRAVTQRGAKLIVVDPRRIELAGMANVFCHIQPGHNIPILNGMMNVILAEDLHDAAYIAERCENFDEFAGSLLEFTPEKVEEITGVPADAIREAARLYATSKPASILYAMGVTQHSQGTDGVKALANLAMLTGHIGRESTGVNPLRGQNNVQGACDMGALPNVYPGYQKVAEEESRLKFEKAWGTKLDPNPGLTITEIMNGAHDGSIKGMYIMGENPMVSDPNLNHVKAALETVDFLVVQDMFLTETAAMADVVFPATSFAEKDGNYTNTERRVLPINQVVTPRGESRDDWAILQDIANVMGAGWNYGGIKDIIDEINFLTPQYGGITYKRIKKGERLQWPCPTIDHPGTRYLHKDGFIRGKGLFAAIDHLDPAEMPCDEYPTVMSTGHMLFR